MKTKILAMFAVLAMLLVACGGGETPTTAPQDQPIPTQSVAASHPEPTVSKPTVPPVDPHPTHCACNGASKGLGDHTCKDVTEWIPLTAECFTPDDGGRMTFKKAGCYYLAEDFVLDKTVNIYPNEDVTICLNGHKLSSDQRLFRISGVLNLCDCKGTGMATSTTRGLVAVAYVYSGGRCNLFGGTLDAGGVTRQQGGVVAIAANDLGLGDEAGHEAVFAMYGGTITGGKVAASENDKNKLVGGVGGNVVAFHAESVFYMYGGTIQNGEAKLVADVGGYGGNLHINNGRGYLYGGTITGGKGAAGGGGVSINKNATLVISGNMKIVDNNGSNLSIRNGNENVVIKDLGADAQIGVGVNGEYTVISKNVDKDVSANFISDDPNFQVTYTEGMLSLTPAAAG